LNIAGDREQGRQNRSGWGYTLEQKREEIWEELLIMRAKVRQETPHWRNAETIAERYNRLCDNKPIQSDLFELEFSEEEGF